MSADFVERRLPFEWAGPGTCINCGFLAWSPHVDSTDAREVPLRRRAYPYGVSPNVPDPLPGWWFCFARAADLSREITKMGEENRELSPADRIAPVLAKNRSESCHDFYTYAEGFNPAWHYQDRLTQALEEMRRANDLKIAELERQSQAAMLSIAAEHAKTAEAQKVIFERNERQTRTYNRLFLWMAGIATILAFGPLFFPRGLPWVADRLNGGDSPAIIVVTAIPEQVPTTTPIPPSTRSTPSSQPQ